MYQVIFWDWRNGHRSVGYSPFYKTKIDCGNFIIALSNLPNNNDFSGFDIVEIKPKKFSEKDIDKFKKA